MVLMEIAQKKFSSKNILIADNALIKMTCPTANLFKPSISMDNYLQVDKQKLFIGRFFYPPNYSGTFTTPGSDRFSICIISFQILSLRIYARREHNLA